MSGNFGKQPGSRPTNYQVLQFNNATVWTTKFGHATQQIRVASQVGGWGTINDTTADSVVATSAGGIGMYITGPTTFVSAGTGVTGATAPEYFTVTPGQVFVFTSTSTTTGACSVTEMA